MGVKGAAANVNAASHGKYFGTSGHAGTRTSGYVTIPEVGGGHVTPGSVKYAALHVHQQLAQAPSNPVGAAIAAHSAGAASAVGVVGGIGHSENMKAQKASAHQSDFDGQDSGHDFNSGSWHTPFGYVNNWDGARDEGFRDYKQA